MLAFIIVVSLIPIEADLGENRDKIGHLLAYGGLMFWFAMLHPGWLRQLALAIAFSAIGVILEFLQGMSGYRSFEGADMLANSTGVVIGWALALSPLKYLLAGFEKLMLRKGAL